MKRIITMPVADYQQLAKRLDRRFSAKKAWDELPLQHAPGRPRKGDRRERLVVHSVKMTAAEWSSLQAEAQALGLTVNALLRTVLRPAVLPRIVAAAGLAS